MNHWMNEDIPWSCMVLHSKILVQWLNFHSVNKEFTCSVTEFLLIGQGLYFATWPWPWKYDQGISSFIQRFFFESATPTQYILTTPCKCVFLLFISIGDVIKGTVTVELSESLDAEKLEIKCLGQARTLIRIYHRWALST